MRLSTTLLDQYRYFRENDYAEWEKLLESIQGKFEPTPAMRVGSALHTAFEMGPYKTDIDHVDVKLEAGGPSYFFDAASLRDAFSRYWEWPIVHDAKTTVEINTALGPVTLVGKADGLIGNTAVELKSSDKAPNLDRHMDSLQWRVYSLAFEVRRVDYILAQIKQKDGVWSVVNCQELPLYPYPELRAEVERWTNDFVLFLQARDLIHHLQPRQRAA